MGYPVRLSEHWTIEPQAQLVYQHQAFDSDEDQYGVFRFEDSDELDARLGARLVRQWESNDGHDYTLWGRLNLWHNTDSEARTSVMSLNGLSSVTLDTELGGTLAQLGMGFNVQMKDDLDFFIAADYKQNLESSRAHSISGRIGLQYRW